MLNKHIKYFLSGLWRFILGAIVLGVICALMFVGMLFPIGMLIFRITMISILAVLGACVLVFIPYIIGKDVYEDKQEKLLLKEKK